MRAAGLAAVVKAAMALAALGLAGAVVGARQDPASSAPRPSVPAASAVSPAAPPFDEWLASFRAEAAAKGISEATLDAALANLAPDPAVLDKERTQPELTQTLDDYLARRVTPKIVATAAGMLQTHATLLARVTDAYGVPAPVMVAVWGAESNFGQIMGSYPLVPSLATLAWEGRRTLFRTELLDALTIVDRKLARLEDLKGSWAGAMGQPQFMPSTYLKFAVDFDGGGTADIWTSPDDVFASMANYLHQAGWASGERWGREIGVPAGGWDAVDAAVPRRTTGCGARKEMTEARPLTTWSALGLTLTDGSPLPGSDLAASLVRGEHRAFLVYRNYGALLDYNCSNAYALSVGLVSDLAGGK